ncbi:MAG: alpha/beta hydrolase [Aureispira sp.]
MKKRLIILSDLWGREKSNWLSNYTPILEEKLDLVVYDNCELGEIERSNYTQDHLHQQFITGRIDKAVTKLIALEKEKINILAFSIGGTIAWKFGFRGGKITPLISISSTRLRKESKPKGKIHLFFGKHDAYKPTIEWLESMNLEYKILLDKEHQIYSEPEFARQLSKQIIKMTL